MVTRFLDISKSHRKKDDNGFLIITQNPIAKAGVFEYLKSEILPDFKGDDGLVRVYRPFEALKKAKDSFANKPIKLTHKWVGDEANTADGAISSEIKADEANGYLIADLIIYNPELIAKIESGEVVELSPAYTGEVLANSGRYDGEDYDFTQSVDCVNHLAVVESGRSGSDLRILDEKPKRKDEKMNLNKFKDELAKLVTKFKDEGEEPVKAEDSDVATKLLEIAKSEMGEAEKIAKINELLSVKDENCVEDSEDEPKPVEDNEPVEDDEPTAIETKDEGEDESQVEAKIAEIVNEAIDKKLSAFQDSLKSEAKKIQDSYAEVSKALGSQFDYTNKSASEIYKLGYELLSGKTLGEGVDAKSAFSVISQIRTPKFADTKPIQAKSESKILTMLENM